MKSKAVTKESYVMWQECTEGVPEQALLIEKSEYGYVTIKQEERQIIINNETLPELIKHLKTIK